MDNQYLIESLDYHLYRICEVSSAYKQRAALSAFNTRLDDLNNFMAPYKGKGKKTFDNKYGIGLPAPYGGDRAVIKAIEDQLQNRVQKAYMISKDPDKARAIIKAYGKDGSLVRKYLMNDQSSHQEPEFKFKPPRVKDPRGKKSNLEKRSIERKKEQEPPINRSFTSPSINMNYNKDDLRLIDDKTKVKPKKKTIVYSEKKRRYGK